MYAAKRLKRVEGTEFVARPWETAALRAGLWGLNAVAPDGRAMEADGEVPSLLHHGRDRG